MAGLRTYPVIKAFKLFKLSDSNVENGTKNVILNNVDEREIVDTLYKQHQMSPNQYGIDEKYLLSLNTEWTPYIPYSCYWLRTAYSLTWQTMDSDSCVVSIGIFIVVVPPEVLTIEKR